MKKNKFIAFCSIIIFALLCKSCETSSIPTGDSYYAESGSSTRFPSGVGNATAIANLDKIYQYGFTPLNASMSNKNVAAKKHQNIKPAFTHGTSQLLTVCAKPTAFNSLLTVRDRNKGQVATWHIVSLPLHGTVPARFSKKMATKNSTPSGFTYVPEAGYKGGDTFVVAVSDGYATRTTTIYVSVMPVPNPGTITGANSVCADSSISLQVTGSGGAWSSSNALCQVADGMVKGITPGRSVISYTVANACGEVAATKVVKVLPNPAKAKKPAPMRWNIDLGEYVSLSKKHLYVQLSADFGTSLLRNYVTNSSDPAFGKSWAFSCLFGGKLLSLPNKRLFLSGGIELRKYSGTFAVPDVNGFVRKYDHYSQIGVPIKLQLVNTKHHGQGDVNVNYYVETGVTIGARVKIPELDEYNARNAEVEIPVAEASNIGQTETSMGRTLAIQPYASAGLSIATKGHVWLLGPFAGYTICRNMEMKTTDRAVSYGMRLTALLFR